jgi:hypothetical protein
MSHIKNTLSQYNLPSNTENLRYVNLHDYGAIPVAGYWRQCICTLMEPLYLQVNGATQVVS